jgi:hypothetical protein
MIVFGGYCCDLSGRSGDDLQNEDFYRYDSRAVRVPLLECVNGWPLRTPPAGLIGFAPAFRKRNKYRVPAFGGLYVGVSNSSSTLYVPIQRGLCDLLPLEAPRERSERGTSSGRRDRVNDPGTPNALPWLSWIRRLFMVLARTVTGDEPLRLGPAFARMGLP